MKSTIENLKRAFAEYMILCKDHPEAVWEQCGDGGKAAMCCAIPQNVNIGVLKAMSGRLFMKGRFEL